jgi:predicted MFS family arabinose efflux permease
LKAPAIIRDAGTKETSSDRAREGAGNGLVTQLLIIGAAAFVTTIAQMEVIGQLPVRYFLKTYLHVNPEQMSLFLLCAALAWYVKPLVGLISDSVSLFGTRRRHYLMISAAAAGVFWLLLGVVPPSYLPLLFVAVMLNLMMVIASTAMGGLLVEQAQRLSATGRLCSLREGLNMLAVTIGLPVGGYLAEAAIGWTALIAACLLFGLAITVFLLLHEAPVGVREEGAVEKSVSQLGVLFGSRTLWAAGGLLFMFYVAPGFATPLYFMQTDELRFSQSFIGWLAVAGGVTGMMGALIYGGVCKVLRLRRLIVIGIALSALTTLLYLFYSSRETALAIVALSGLVGTFGVIPLYDLAARATPKGCEALGFALMMSLRNLAVNGADWVGSWLIQTHQWQFSSLVWINAGTTMLVLLAVPLLPRHLLDRSDTDVRVPDL